MELGECSAEVAFGCRRGTVGFDPFEHQNRRIKADVEDLGHRNNTCVAQPLQSDRLGLEEVRRRARAGLGKDDRAVVERHLICLGNVTPAKPLRSGDGPAEGLAYDFGDRFHVR